MNSNIRWGDVETAPSWLAQEHRNAWWSKPHSAKRNHTIGGKGQGPTSPLLSEHSFGQDMGSAVLSACTRASDVLLGCTDERKYYQEGESAPCLWLLWFSRERGLGSNYKDIPRARIARSAFCTLSLEFVCTEPIRSANRVPFVNASAAWIAWCITSRRYERYLNKNNFPLT